MSFGWATIVTVGPLDTMNRTLEGYSGAKTPRVSIVQGRGVYLANWVV